MKEWTVDEFLEECEMLCWNQYTYDYSRMPEGYCNGHKVKPYTNSWHSIVIDGGICNLAHCSKEHPNGFTTYVYRGREMTWKEYVREKLTESLPFSALMHVNPQFKDYAN